MKDPAAAKLTVYVPQELADRARAAAGHLAGAPLYLKLADLHERALRREVEDLEREYNGGRPFPPPPAKKRPGRPVGS